MKMIEVQQCLREAEWKWEVAEARKQGFEEGYKEGRQSVITTAAKNLIKLGNNKATTTAQLVFLFNLTPNQAEAYYAAAMTQTKA